MDNDGSQIAQSLYELSAQKRAQEYDIVTIASSMAQLGGASDRVLVVDFPIVQTNRHWVVFEAIAKWQSSYGAAMQAIAWLCKVDSARASNYGFASKTPATGGIKDTTALVDFSARTMPLALAIDQRYILADQIHEAGIVAAGIGEVGIIVRPGWFLRAILGTSGTADGANWTRPFAPLDATMEFSVGYMEEFTVRPCD